VSAPEIPRQSIGDVRRAELIDAAVITLARQGYKKTTVRDVARAAGTSPGSVLYYFDSTEALLAAAFERADKQFRDRVRGELEPLHGAARLRRLVELCLPTPAEASPAWDIEMDLWSLSARRTDFRAIFQAANDDWLAVLTEAFEQAIAARELTEVPDVGEAVMALAALIDGLAVYTRVTDTITAASARRIALHEVERLCARGNASSDNQEHE